MKVNIGKYSLRGNHRHVKIQIEKFDTWNLDHTLAMIILPALIQLKYTKHGIPGNLEEIPEDYNRNQLVFDFYNLVENDEEFKRSQQRWNNILDKMIWSFQQLVDGNYDQIYYHGTPDITFEPIPNSTNVEMIDNNPNDHWYDAIGAKLHVERIQEGLDLFSRYYMALWD